MNSRPPFVLASFTLVLLAAPAQAGHLEPTALVRTYEGPATPGTIISYGPNPDTEDGNFDLGGVVFVAGELGVPGAADAVSVAVVDDNVGPVAATLCVYYNLRPHPTIPGGNTFDSDCEGIEGTGSIPLPPTWFRVPVFVMGLRHDVGPLFAHAGYTAGHVHAEFT